MAPNDKSPEFANPPLDEVVLGVQFSDIPRYTCLDSHEIWSLFSIDYPKVEERPLLEPRFETFGGGPRQPNVHFRVGTAPVGSRLWFLSSDENHLLQFQPNKFLINWRNRPQPQAYPRFENILKNYYDCLSKLRIHLESKFEMLLDINQVEVVYINIIQVEKFSEVSDWLDIVSPLERDVESLKLSFTEVICDDEDSPSARLFHEIDSVIDPDSKQKAVKLSLTFRGRPWTSNVDGALNFLRTGHDLIVRRFMDVTSDKAQAWWGKK